MCVCAIITTFSKHLRPPWPVFIAGNRDGPTLVRKTISEDGREKNGGLEGSRMTRRGCAEGQRVRRLTDWPIPIVMFCTRDVPKDLTFSGKMFS